MSEEKAYKEHDFEAEYKETLKGLVETLGRKEVFRRLRKQLTGLLADVVRVEVNGEEKEWDGFCCALADTLFYADAIIEDGPYAPELFETMKQSHAKAWLEHFKEAKA